MLRHFAVLTIVITVCIAIFAEGEKGDTTAAKPQAAAQSSGGAMSAMLGGAEEAALKQSRENKPGKEVSGLRLGLGTRLGDNSSQPDEGRQEFNAPVMGDVQYSEPDHHVALDANGRLAEAAPVAQPPPMVKDGNGVPAPAVTSAIGKLARPGKQPPPRRSTKADFDRMMANSAARSGKASTDAEAD